MVQLYNFLGSWQLFPEKGQYEEGGRPKSGLYQVETQEESRTLTINHSWTTIENQGFNTRYQVKADGERHPFPHPEIADSVQVQLIDSISFNVHLFLGDTSILHIAHHIEPNGYLKVTHKGQKPDGTVFTTTDFYHKQMSVLPYAASVSGAVIRPTKEGVIKHKALAAMEEQTNMQLDQIRKQVELLAQQAREIHKRKELSMMIYGAKLSFKPEIGQVYYLYEKNDGSHILSLISPQEWGGAMPYNRHVAAVQLLADHTWKEVGEM